MKNYFPPFNNNLNIPTEGLFRAFCQGKFDTLTLRENEISNIVNSQLNMDFRPDVLWTIVEENFLYADNQNINELRQYIKLAIEQVCYRVAITAFCPEHVSLINSWIFKPFPTLEKFLELKKTSHYFDGFPLVNVDIFINHDGEIEAELTSRIAYINYNHDEDDSHKEVEELNFN